MCPHPQQAAKKTGITKHIIDHFKGLEKTRGSGDSVRTYDDQINANVSDDAEDDRKDGAEEEGAAQRSSSNSMAPSMSDKTAALEAAKVEESTAGAESRGRTEPSGLANVSQ